MGIAERIEEKLDLVLSLLQSGQSVDLVAASQSAQSEANTASSGAIAGTAPAVATNAGNTEDAGLDSAGMPWDARIHSSSKEKVVAGTWKYKRGVEQNVKDAVENEFRAAGFGSANVAQPAAASVAAAPDVQTSLPAATPAAGAVNLPGLSLPVAPPVAAAPEPVRVVMPAYVEGAELDDSQLTNVAAAAYARIGEQKYLHLLTEIFKMAAGTAITDLPQQYRDSFHRIVAQDELLKHYGLI